MRSFLQSSIMLIFLKLAARGAWIWQMPCSKRRKLFSLQIEWFGDAKARESEERV